MADHGKKHGKGGHAAAAPAPAPAPAPAAKGGHDHGDHGHHGKEQLHHKKEDHHKGGDDAPVKKEIHLAVPTSPLAPGAAPPPPAPSYKPSVVVEHHIMHHSAEDDAKHHAQWSGLSLHKQIAAARNAAHMTQQELASTICEKPTVIHDFENGKIVPNAHQLSKLSHALGVTLPVKPLKKH